MSTQSKLTLIIELKNKMFNNKLMETKRKLDKVTDKMKGKLSRTTANMRSKLNRLKVSFLSNFSEMRNEIPLLDRAFKLLGNPFVLITAGLMSMSVALGNAIDHAKRFNHEFLQIRNLNLDKSAGSLDNYKKQIRNAAFETGQNLEKATLAFYDLQSATGLYGQQAETVFRKVARYSIATGADLNDSINATTKAMKAFGLTQKDIDRYLESNAKTVQTGIVNFKELAQVQTEFAGAAAGAGQSVDTANKLFAVFTSITKDARIGATMTKMAFLGLTQESTIKGLQEIGVKLYDANGKMRDLADILVDVKDRFKTMNSRRIDEIINKIGGPEGLRNMFIKLKTNALDFERTMQAFDSSKFNLDKAFANARKDAVVLGNIVRNKIGAILARIGEKFLPVINKILIGIDKVLTWIWKHWNDIADAVESFGLAIAIVGGILKGATAASYLFSGGLTAVWTGLQAIKTAIFNIPIVGWILLAVTAIIYLIKKTDGWRKQWENLKAFFKDTMQIIATSISIKWHDVIDTMLNGIDKARIAWYKLKNTLGLGDQQKNLQAIAEIEDRINKRRMDQELRKAKLRDQWQNRHQFHWKLRWASGTKKSGTEESPLSDSFAGDGDFSSGNMSSGNKGSVRDGLTTVTGNASAPRSINIHIEALNKGGINISNEHISQMSHEELEEFFNEMFMRIIRNAELIG